MPGHADHLNPLTHKLQGQLVETADPIALVGVGGQVEEEGWGQGEEWSSEDSCFQSSQKYLNQDERKCFVDQSNRRRLALINDQCPLEGVNFA